jgi:hypothetical protein
VPGSIPRRGMMENRLVAVVWLVLSLVSGCSPSEI